MGEGEGDDRGRREIWMKEREREIERGMGERKIERDRSRRERKIGRETGVGERERCRGETEREIGRETGVGEREREREIGRETEKTLQKFMEFYLVMLHFAEWSKA